ncbi:chemotaxis protein CheB [Rhodanobacter glycinis]|uniref:protein-glutamate methylesterase n=1 Tax=Rhodanobacter glycinis TaxID=582702 RepID=A0A502C6R6_9GAMM|nr:chemotaxis protein CheB [Rhodanobacter glycinis]TPG08608.1 chemotaxis protein CheB [Rhodanobacter glycinis]TPG47799.1 chemotaxis protein CheB [Rhodanobacter glycinis]
MTDTAPAVALLFDDTELGAQLREALHERGARIVHEGGVSSITRELLQQVGADVLVVNLDDSADDALDQLYEVIDGNRPRVVFNDAHASRTLVGWDRARWARHLAVKVLAVGDVDPPRPEDARVVEAPQTAVLESVPRDTVPVEVPVTIVEVAAASQPPVEPYAEPAAMEMESEPEPEPEPEPESESEPDFLMHDDPEQHEQTATAESENLAAELEALLASGELPSDEEEGAGSGLLYLDDEELPPLHDGNFGAALAMPESEASLAQSWSVSNAETLPDMPTSSFETAHLQLSTPTDSSITTIPATAAEPVLRDVASSARAPEGWALLDDAVPPAAVAAGRPDAAAFGIEKLSAADFLAPDVEPMAAGVEAVMSLELVSMEEAIAPQAYVHDHEMLLDDLGTALSRIVVLGAAVSGTDSVCDFLAALPATTRLTFLHTQHLGEQSDVALVERFAASCALPVRLAEQGGRAGVGEFLVVPAGHQVRVRRDGKIELLANGADASPDPSIDASLTMAANAFGRDALAIIFAGRGNDAVAGAQAIHDRGGRVWVESSSGEHFADMVSGIFAERLVSFSGTPPELAAHLIEVFP